MAISLVGKPADFCPDNCQHMSLEIQDTTLYAEHQIYLVSNTVVCTNHAICAMWQPKEETNE